MKELEALELPEDVRYTQDHEWAREEEDGLICVGITDYAQDQLGDITFVELPEVGDTFDQGDEFGTLESTKAVSELFIPLGGEVVEINGILEDQPQLVNNDPYNKGWIAKVKPENKDEMGDLLDREDYLEMLKGLE